MSNKPTDQNTEPNRKEITKMLKFYFSNANYSKDKFLREECEKSISETDSTKRGIPISTLLIFNKLKLHKATREIIIELINNDDELKKLIEIKKVDEKDYLLKKDMENYKEYADKVSKDPDAFILRLAGVTGELEEVRQYISQFMDPLLIRLRRDKNRKFTGSCFVELPSLKQVEEVLQMKIPIMKKGVERENSEAKKQKLETQDLEFMQITKKSEWMNKPQMTDEEKQRQVLLHRYKGKFYFFESPDFPKNTEQNKEEKEPKTDEEKKEEKVKVQALKTKIGCQFVDLSKNVLRFRDAQNFEEKEVEGVKLIKLTCDEEKKYVNEIPVNSKGGSGRKQRRS